MSKYLQYKLWVYNTEWLSVLLMRQTAKKKEKMKKYKLGYEVYIDNKDKIYNTDDEYICLYIGYDKNEASDIECLYNGLKNVVRIYNTDEFEEEFMSVGTTGWEEF